jgi:hypothetical protein
MKKYPTATAFISKFRIDDKMLESLKEYLVKSKANGVHIIGKEAGFRQILSALIGRNLFDKDAYYPILNANDNAILKGIEVLSGTLKD